MRLPRLIWLTFGLIFIGLFVVMGVVLAQEMRTSRLQSEALSRYATKLTYHLQPGPAKDVVWPDTGPYNERLGYVWTPYFLKALGDSGFSVTWQAQPSATFNDFVRRGGFPIYRAKAAAGLTIFDRHGQLLHNAKYPTRTFASYEEIPPILVESLLFVENRELMRTEPVTHNPAIEWDRFAFAVFGQAVGLFIPGFNAGGGSTLATQIEKFRNSPEGRTNGAFDKLRQIASASVRAYIDGPDTTQARHRIVLDYLNTTPLTARAGWGEINGVGDGLWAWYGIDLQDAVAAMRNDARDEEDLQTKARLYKHALSLVLAERRPTYYLLSNRNALNDLTDVTLDNLAASGVVPVKLRDAAKAQPLRFLPQAPGLPQTSFVEQKAVNAIRTHLLGLLGLPNLYELDRFDISVGSTLDTPTQKKVTDYLQKLKDPAFVQQIGLQGFRMLGEDSDPSKINWTFVLYERGAAGNEVRVQADNLDKPLDLNEGGKLDLGSTAKFRTTVTYLEIMAELHARYAAMDDAALDAVSEEAPDILTQWAVNWLRHAGDKSLKTMLQAAMQRSYSASPGEAFFTGGGLHTFHNFEPNDNGKIVPLTEAFRKSINLPFIRLMRDIVNYTIAHGPTTKEEILGDPDHPARRAYLERFADTEGSVFQNRYFNDYRTLSPDDALMKLAKKGRKSLTARTVLFRSIRPKASFDAYKRFMRSVETEALPAENKLRSLYDSYPIERYSLADRGYVVKVHPLELWLVNYLQTSPNATRKHMLAASREERIATYSWLFRASRKAAQDTRIRILLEQDAFHTIHRRWARLGYPFDRLVPSYATSIGSSGDRPGALADLMGIIVNNGVKLPTVRIDQVNFAPDTPWQTILVNSDPEGKRVLPQEVAEVTRESLMDVVANGTAKRASGVFADASGLPLPVGGKTGTGDHRFDEFAPGGRLISSRVVNRTATFVFFIGDRFYGAITAHVAGPEAAKYSFTSALPSQMLKSLAPELAPLIQGPKPMAATETEPKPEVAGIAAMPVQHQASGQPPRPTP